MDKKKFNEIVEQYMMFEKRTLAEFLTFRDMTIRNMLKNKRKPLKKVDTETKRYCLGIRDYCYTKTCANCLFSNTKQTEQPDGLYVTDGLYVMDKDCTTVSGKSPDFVTTTTN